METFYVIYNLGTEGIRKMRCSVEHTIDFGSIAVSNEGGKNKKYDCPWYFKIGVDAFRTENKARKKISVLMNEKINELREELARFESESKKEIFVVDCD